MRLDRLFNSLPTYKDGKHRVKVNGSWKSVDEDKFKKNISSYDQITLNTRSYKHAVIFDVDDPEIYLAPEISPYTSTFNMENDKSHQLFLLDKPIFTKSDRQREWYLDNIQAPLAKITFLINADVNYKNLSTKNPFSDKYRVNAHGKVLGSVFDLISLYNEDLQSVSAEELSQKKDHRYISEKYKLMVSQLIEHSMMNGRLIFSDPESYEKSMMLKGRHIGESLNISNSNIIKITRDAIAKGRSLAEVFSQRQKKRSKKANMKRWGNQTEITKTKIRDAVITLKASGSKITYPSISTLSGIPVSTIKNYAQLIKTLKA